MSGAAITLQIGDNSHKAVATNTNLDGTHASGVISNFTSDNPGVCDVNPNTGDLIPTAAGVANITEISTRGAFTHTDMGTVTVQDANSGDFTTSLTFT